MSKLLSKIATTGRNAIRAVYDRLPLHLRANPVYWNTLELLQQTERWSQDRLEEFQVEQLRKLLRHCAANVPYYRDLFRQAGFNPESVRPHRILQGSHGPFMFPQAYPYCAKSPFVASTLS